MATHEDMVCLHGEGTYVTATGLACARCGEMLCRHDESDDDRPDEWRENDWNGGPEVTPNSPICVTASNECSAGKGEG